MWKDGIRKLKKNKKYALLLEIIDLIIFALCMYFLFNVVILLNITPTESMQPTIMVGDFSISNGLAYINGSPERGDIIIFDGENGKTLVKRVIGIPNDVITFVDGHVVINGIVTEEEYVSDGNETKTYGTDTFMVPEGHYFVLGDNRESSADSRFFNQPYISKDRIKAKVLFIIRTSIFKRINQ